jgi:transposase
MRQQPRLGTFRLRHINHDAVQRLDLAGAVHRRDAAHHDMADFAIRPPQPSRPLETSAARYRLLHQHA